MQEVFEVISITREDLEYAGVKNFENLSDTTMQNIANAMADLYLNNGYAEDLQLALDKYSDYIER
nr:MAG TPA: hypothetical protein [Crassvirales sp.]